MRRDHQTLLHFDRMRWTSPRAKPVWMAMEPLFPPSVRLLLCAYERDGYDPMSRDGRAHLRTMCEHIPDSKCVEDLHEKIRDLRRLGMFNAGGTLQSRQRPFKINRRACTSWGRLSNSRLTQISR
jgi:hypothetical protein